MTATRTAYTDGGPLIGAQRSTTTLEGAENVSIGIVTFPGTLDDRDAARAVTLSCLLYTSDAADDLLTV